MNARPMAEWTTRASFFAIRRGSLAVSVALLGLHMASAVSGFEIIDGMPTHWWRSAETSGVSLQFTPQNEVAVAFTSSDQQLIKYARLTSDGWLEETVDNEPGIYPVLVHDIVDTPHIAYTGRGGRIRHATRERGTGNWSSELLASEWAK